MSDESHLPRRLADPSGWVAYVSRAPVRRLVVFVHGFRGEAVGTWRRFADRSGDVGDWWRESDLLFVGYDSVRETIVGVADRLRERLPEFFPAPPDALVQAGEQRIREGVGRYDELYLVGHSLGGVIVRRALADAAEDWGRDLGKDPAKWPALLDATVRLFSPASAGFRAAGLLGVLKASLGWYAIEIYLRRSSAYVDLQPGSTVLRATRQRTQQLVAENDSAFGALRAWVVFANPDDIVETERYDTDHVQKSAHGRDHSSVCKPDKRYQLPWIFVETGRIR